MTLKINDVFWTFQGEGWFAGRRALFVRMPYCNLKCPWCDTEFNSHKDWTEEEFIKIATEEKCRFAVITGGEPMMNKQTPEIVRILKKLGFYIAAETNGNFPMVPDIDFVTCSPKRDAKEPYYINPLSFQKVDEYKYVVDDRFDFSILDRHKPGGFPRLSLSPEFNQMEKSIEKIMAYIKEHPQWQISLQTHKWLKIP